jgi:D-alanine-D-alanine ligase
VRVAILGGGRSSEHEVSLASARAICRGARRAGHDVSAITIDRRGRWWDGRVEVAVAPGEGVLDTDVVFPALHGAFGEDGTVQGLLEIAGVPYVGSGVLATAMCMNKAAFKRRLAGLGLPQGPFAVVPDGDHVPGLRVDLPCFVKPASTGSSFGITRVTGRGELMHALRRAHAHSPEAVVEPAIAGIEVECAVIGNRTPYATEPGEVVTEDDDWQSYEVKYGEGRCGLVIPVRATSEMREQIRSLACRVFRLLGCAGLARVDFFLTDQGPLINEVNTMPGFGSASSFPALVKAGGTSYEELIDRVLTLALERHATRHVPPASRNAAAVA